MNQNATQTDGQAPTTMNSSIITGSGVSSARLVAVQMRNGEIELPASAVGTQSQLTSAGVTYLVAQDPPRSGASTPLLAGAVAALLTICVGLGTYALRASSNNVTRSAAAGGPAVAAQVAQAPAPQAVVVQAPTPAPQAVTAAATPATETAAAADAKARASVARRATVKAPEAAANADAPAPRATSAADFLPSGL